jgi:nucleotidyltransferase/DNA polymerase involved in DNA repair
MKENVFNSFSSSAAERGKRDNYRCMNSTERNTGMRHLPKRIAFISVPHIFAEGERARRREYPVLPLVIVSGSLSKSVVIDYSRNLEGSTVKKGAFLRDIAFLKDKVRIVPADYEYVEKLSENVVAWLKHYSPLVESPCAGEYYLDLTGTKTLLGRELDTCGKIMRDLKRIFGFTSRAGIGSSLLISRMASRTAGTGGVYDIYRSAESLFLAPLSIELLTELSTEVKTELLEGYNIHCIGDLLLFSKNDLLCMFEKEGRFLYNCSRDFSRNSLIEKKTEKVLEKELIVSSENNDDVHLRRYFFSMILDLCTKMRREYIFPKTFSIRIIYQDNFRHVLSGKLKNPSFFEKNLYRDLIGYLDRALKRRTCVKKILLSFSHFITPSPGLPLFDESFRMEKLAEAFDRVQKRYGKNSLRYGA